MPPSWEVDEASDYEGEVVSEASSSETVGEKLHGEIPPSMWCVTRADLRALRRAVRQSVRDGSVYPTARDNFSTSDTTIGPSLYTVVEQYIKPSTESSGASWALGRHPRGLACDVFVTHAWAEGLYEFVDKVLASWPIGARSAWICALSMPQHLNIAELLEMPKKSPFEEALASAMHILVVPNRSCSVYARLWCVYEAFLAQQQGKLVRMAIRRDSRGLALAALGVAVSCAVGAALGVVEGHCRDELPSLYLFLWVLLAVSLLVGGQHVRRAIHLAGCAICVYFLASPGHNVHRLHDLGYFLVAELDRVRLAAFEVEAENLKRGFERSARHARCTKAEDESAIWGEIGSATDEVDHVIDVLIRATQASPLWTALSEQGLDITCAGFTPWACPSYLLGVIVIHTAQAIAKARDGEAVCMTCVTLAAQAFGGLLLVVLSSDRRAFCVFVFEKMTMLYFCLHACVSVSLALLQHRGDLQDGIFKRAKLVFICVTLLLAAIPPVILVRAPLVGPGLVQLFLRRVRLSPPSCPWPHWLYSSSARSFRQDPANSQA